MIDLTKYPYLSMMVLGIGIPPEHAEAINYLRAINGKFGLTLLVYSDSYAR